MATVKVVVLGGTGLIGSEVVALLRERGHEAIAASPSTGVDAAAGVGLDEAFVGADVVVDVTNSRDFSEAAVIDFFTRGTNNALAAEQRAGVGHHVILSIVGVDRDAEAKGYLAGKVAQERLVAAGTVPFTIVRATQFFEFLSGILESSTVDGQVRVAPVLLQPVAAEAVSRLIADAALAPASGVIELAGPERAPLAEFLERVLADADVPLPVIVDDSVGYFGRAVEQTSLVPVGDAVIDPLTFDRWKAAQPH